MMLRVVALLVLAMPAYAATERSSTMVAHFKATHPCPANGHTKGACPGYVVDHIIPLCAGGDDAVYNMQWQTYAESKTKDKREVAYCTAHRKANP